jgi:hypothetical protein
LLPPEEVEGTLFQCIFLKKLPSAMSDAIMAADLDNIEAMADMADRLHDKPTAPTVAAVTPCCSHVSAIDSQQRKNNRAGRSPNRSCENNGPVKSWTAGAKKSWCFKHKFFGNKATSCNPPCSYAEN